MRRTESTAAAKSFDSPLLGASLVAPAITKHSGVTCVLPGRLWTVSGAVNVGGKVNFPVTMTVIKERDGSLVLVNSLRFPDAVNAEVLALAGSDEATVHVVRLGCFHGVYDSFWVKELGARGRLWALGGHKLPEGLVADKVLAVGCLPISGAELFEFALGKAEAAIVLREERFALFCDAVRNISTFKFVSWYSAPVVRAKGLRGAVHHAAPRQFTGWKAEVVRKESMRAEYDRLLECEFDGYSSAHGPAVVRGAREKIGAAVTARLGAVSIRPMGRSSLIGRQRSCVGRGCKRSATDYSSASLMSISADMARPSLAGKGRRLERR